MFILSFILLVIIAAVDSNNDNLKAVVQIFRHGQRTPFRFYPTDPYGDLQIYWGGVGHGQLTDEGKRQHYALGKFTRNRYSDWLPEIYNKNDIYVESTDSNRTRLSAECNLNGLFPNKSTKMANEDADKIPVHTSDPRILNFRHNCPLYDILINHVNGRNELRALDAEYSNLYSHFSQHSGFNITSIINLGMLLDILIAEAEVGFNLPNWVDPSYPEPIKTLYSLTFERRVHTTHLQRLFTGPLLNEIIAYFEEMAQNSTFLPKYKMYSAHDINLMAILKSIDDFNEIKPVPFAASIWFELRNMNFVNVVNVWYKEDDDMRQLSIKGCDLNCPLTEVRNLLRDILVDIET